MNPFRSVLSPHEKRAFLKQFAVLTAGISLQNLLTYSVNLADNLMLGAYSESALSGAALCNQIQFFLQMLVLGISEGVVILCSQYWGKKQIPPIKKIIVIGVWFGSGVSVILFAMAQLTPYGLLGLLANDPSVIQEGVRYLVLISFTYVVFTATNVLVASLRSIGIVRIGYLITASTLCLNILLNSLLIYGRFGFPELGIRGAAVATLFSRCVELLIVIGYLHFREHTLNLTFRDLFRPDWSYLRDFLHTSFPVMLAQMQWGIAMMVQTAILGHLGQSAIAANSIATTIYQIVTVVVDGECSAIAVIVGRTIGAQRFDLLRGYTALSQRIFILIGVLTSALLLAIRGPILSLYAISPQTYQLSSRFILILCLTILGTAYQVPSLCGIVRGGGNTRFDLFCTMIATWIFSIPIAVTAAFVLHLSPVVVFFFLKWDQLLKCIPAVIKVNRFTWIREVTRPA